MIDFSVLMPIYHGEIAEIFSQSLESLFIQELPAKEVVIVKDGILTDELEHTLSGWREKLPLKIVGYDENKGIAFALNYGLQFCSYGLVARMDSDDICLPDRFKKQISCFDKNKEIVVLGTNIMEFYENNNKIIYIRERKYPVFTDKSSKYLYKGTPIAHPTVMIRTELLKKYQYNTNTFLNEDIDLWFRLLADGYSIENINEPLLKYRITEKTFLRRSSRKAFSEFKIYWKNLIKLHGFSLLLLFPLMRVGIRLLPVILTKGIYFSRERKSLLSDKKLKISNTGDSKNETEQ